MKNVPQIGKRPLMGTRYQLDATDDRFLLFWEDSQLSTIDLMPLEAEILIGALRAWLRSIGRDAP